MVKKKDIIAIKADPNDEEDFDVSEESLEHGLADRRARLDMKYFHAVVHKDEDGAYGVHFPDLPGCFSAADDLDDVLPNAIEAMELWLEDEAEPDASGLEAIRERAAEDLAEGAFLIAVPRVANSRG